MPILSKGTFSCYAQFNESVLASVNYLYIVNFKADIDEHGTHSKLSSLDHSRGILAFC